MSPSAQLRKMLCESWCSSLDIAEDTIGTRLSLPAVEPDGDTITVWLTPRLGGWHIRDCGATLMRLSYSMDVDQLEQGSRARVLDRILAEHAVALENGELTLETDEAGLPNALLRFGQALQRVGDIRLWTRARVASTFYEDLEHELRRILGDDRVVKDYVVQEIPDAAAYPVDFAVTRSRVPVYIFGVPSNDKAKLATIILQHFQQSRHVFESLVVLSGLESISRGDLRRLMNTANEMVDSPDSTEALERKLTRLAA